MPRRHVKMPFTARLIFFALLIMASLWGVSHAFAWISAPSDVGVVGGVVLLILLIGLWVEFFRLSVYRRIVGWVRGNGEEHDPDVSPR